MRIYIVFQKKKKICWFSFSKLNAPTLNSGIHRNISVIHVSQLGKLKDKYALVFHLFIYSATIECFLRARYCFAQWEIGVNKVPDRTYLLTQETDKNTS